MSSPSPVGQSRRLRAPTITIDTSAVPHHSPATSPPILRPILTGKSTPPELRENASFESRESRPTSPHNTSSPQQISHRPEFSFSTECSPWFRTWGYDSNSPFGCLADMYIPFIPVNQSAHDIVSHDYAKLTTKTKTTLAYEPEISGYLNGTAVAFFPDNQSALDIVSHNYAKRNLLKINTSTKGRLRTARGSQGNTLGTVSREVRFAGESETYVREFHVLPNCVYDVILGGPFLRLTQTLTTFRNRIKRTLRGMSPRHRVCFTGSTQEMLSGWANGQSVLALPDTGSDVCLMSLRYARERGYRIDTNPKHRELLEFVDGSTAETFGRVEGFQWEFDRSDIQVHTPEIHVLENLQTDLLLGYDFLEDSDAFVTHEELFIDAEPPDEPVSEMFGWLVSAIKLITSSKTWGYGRQFAQKLGWKSPNSEPSNLQKWHDRKPHELTNYEKDCTAARALSEPYRTSALHDARVKWNEFWVERPGCGNDANCSTQTPCGHDGCNYIAPVTSTSGPPPTHGATCAVPIHDLHPPDMTTAGAGAVPDPGPALPLAAQIPNTAGTNPPSTVNPPRAVTNLALALQMAITAPQAIPQTPDGWLTVWRTATGLVRMFAKSDNKMLIATALLLLCCFI